MILFKSLLVNWAWDRRETIELFCLCYVELLFFLRNKYVWSKGMCGKKARDRQFLWSW